MLSVRFLIFPAPSQSPAGKPFASQSVLGFMSQPFAGSQKATLQAGSAGAGQSTAGSIGMKTML
jgi:hypothetical protein